MNPISEVFNTDCMRMMREMEDKTFDLAIIDPPYGIGESGKTNGTRSKLAKSKNYHQGKKDWDNEPPPPEYFKELFRVSKNQVIFGANHFIDRIPHASPCWIVWDKKNGATDFADAELAWTSFSSAVRIAKFRWQGMLQGNMKEKEIRIHPTQKPVALYQWIIQNYTKPGQSILDTHLGSGSSRIAAFKNNRDFIGIEIDADYFSEQERRFKKESKQIQIIF